MILRQLSGGVLDLLYPPRCLVCGATPKVYRDHFCAECNQALFGDRALRCPRCATTVGPFSLSDNACAACRHQAPAFARTACLGSYRGALREAVLRIKHATGEGLAELLGARWAAAHSALLDAVAIDAVVPVPLHWWRRLSRGYNQSAAVARGLADRLGLPLRTRWLRRIRATMPQKTLTATARQTNLAGAFRARHGVVGRHLLLVDDVMTTGTTAQEAARALLRRSNPRDRRGPGARDAGRTGRSNDLNRM